MGIAGLDQPKAGLAQTGSGGPCQQARAIVFDAQDILFNAGGSLAGVRTLCDAAHALEQAEANYRAADDVNDVLVATWAAISDAAVAVADVLSHEQDILPRKADLVATCHARLVAFVG